MTSSSAPMISSSNLLISGGNFVQVNHAKLWAFEKLQDASSPSAFHNSDARFDASKCHANTRVAVLQKIMQWIMGHENRDALITWLSGPAGAGKSTIALSIAELCEAERLILACFFFSRIDHTRNHASTLFPTIAYQIATTISQARDHIENVIDRDPTIFSRSIEVQLQSLVLEPLRHLSNSAENRIPALIIIDGLDECGDSALQCRILQTISNALKVQDPGLSLKFLITSRPEHDISNAFNYGYLNTAAVTRLVLDDSYHPSADIEHFLRDKFREIRQIHPAGSRIASSWPSDNSIQYLVQKSSGQFIYASTVVKYVTSTHHQPPARLEIILGLRPVSSSRDMPFAELDMLYAHILSTVNDIELVYDILTLSPGVGSALRTWIFPATDIEKLFSLPADEIPYLLADLRSIITCSEWNHGCISHNISFLHESFPDFLLDPTRSQHLYINPGKRAARLLSHCLNHTSQRKSPNQDFYNDFFSGGYEIENIQKYIKYFCSVALELGPAPHPNRSLSLNKLATLLFGRFKQKEDIENIEESIQCYQEAFELFPASHPSWSVSINNLAVALQKALELFPAPYPRRSIWLDNLGNVLYQKFQHKKTRKIEDLEESIRCQREALELRPAPHPNRPNLLNNLAAALYTRSERLGDIENLEESIQCLREALELRPAPHPNRSDLLNNLVVMLSTRFEKKGDIENLEESIQCLREALELRLASHTHQSGSPPTSLAQTVTSQLRILHDLSQREILKTSRNPSNAFERHWS